MSRPFRVLLLWLLAMMAGMWCIHNANVVADMSFFLPSRPSAEQQVLVSQLKNGSVSRLLMLGLEGGDAVQRAKMSRALRQDLNRQGLFVTVQNGADESFEVERDLLLRYRYLLSPAINSGHFSVEGLRESIGESIDVLTSPMGGMIKPFFFKDPTGELLALLHRLSPSDQPRLEEGVWSSADGQRALLLLQTKALGSDIDAQEQALNSVRDTFGKLRDTSHASDLRLEMSGPALFAINSRAAIKNDISRLFLISSFAMLALLWFVYRSIRLMAIGLMPVASAVVAGVVAVSLMHDTVFAITIGFGTSLVGEAVDYAIYFFMQSAQGGMDEWKERFWPTVKLGVMTTVFGFGALLFSSFPGLAQLGLHSLAGVVCAALVTRFVLPVVVQGGVKVPNPGRVGDAIAATLRHATVLRWPLVVLTCLSLGYLFTHRHDLWTPNLSVLSSVTQSEASLDTRLRSDLRAPDARYMVVIQASDQEQVLQGAERAAIKLDALVEKGYIGGYDNPARFLPSVALQTARREALPAMPELRKNLDLALSDAPLSAARLEPFILDVSQAKELPLVTRETLTGSTLSLAVDSLLTHDEDGWTALLPLRPTQGQAIDLPLSVVREALAGSGAVFVDMKSEFEVLYAQYIEQAQLLSMAGMGCIMVLLIWRLRSIRSVVQVLLPLVASIVLVMAGLHLFGQQLHLLHLVGILLVVAVGSNYALFFVRSDSHQPMDALASMSLVTACLTAVIGFGVLILSSVPVLHAIGLTVGPGVLFALLFSAAWSQQEFAA